MARLPSFFYSMLPTPLTVPCPRSAPRRARGFGLLQVLLLISVMAGLATMGYLQWREHAMVDSSRQERQALAQADRALVAFATVMHRLPCPATERDGLENCTAPAQKGWLPSATLRLAGVDPGVDVGQLRYMVQRQEGSNDLSVLTDSWTPMEYNGSFSMRVTTGKDAYSPGIETLTDFCQRLDAARGTPNATSLARVNASSLRPVAYALAHPGGGDASGDGDLFDGANSSANPNLMEDPARRPVLALYNDLVLERSFSSLLSAFHCQPLMDSINTVALGHDVAGHVDGMRSENIESAKRAVAFSTLAAIMTALDITQTVLEGISDATNSAVDWVACAASLGLAVNFCTAAPIHTAATALVGGVVYANTAAVALNAYAANIAGKALKLADGNAKDSDICPPLTKDQKEMNDRMKLAAEQGVNDAIAELAKAESAVDQKKNELDWANLYKANAVNELYAAVRNGAERSDADPAVGALLAAADGWYVKYFDKKKADANVQQARDEYNQWVAEVARFEGMLNNASAAVIRINSEIAEIDAKIILASESDKPNLQAKRAAKVAELAMIDNPAEVAKQRNAAIVKRNEALQAYNSAVADYNSANGQYASARSSYTGAYNHLMGLGEYFSRKSNGDAVQVLCINGCQVGSISVSSRLSSALIDIFGWDFSNGPDEDYKYLKPLKIKKELDALVLRFADAEKRKKEADAQLAEVNRMLDNPAACNIPSESVVPMTPEQALDILIKVDQRGGTR